MSTSGQKRIESTIDTAIDCDEDEVMELAMQAGELLLENGAEIFRTRQMSWVQPRGRASL